MATRREKIEQKEENVLVHLHTVSSKLIRPLLDQKFHFYTCTVLESTELQNSNTKHDAIHDVYLICSYFQLFISSVRYFRKKINKYFLLKKSLNNFWTHCIYIINCIVTYIGSHLTESKYMNKVLLEFIYIQRNIVEKNMSKISVWLMVIIQKFNHINF